MADADEISEDEELSQAKKKGTIREGMARIHYKIFPKYGFLLPDDSLYSGETIFFGLTAHVNASCKYIADLREELFPEQRVKYLAVPVERDGTVKWKALVVSPLPQDDHDISIVSGESSEANQQWLKCTIHSNLQQTHGFATPEGGNQYHDNVYFSLRQASEGLEETVIDLTKVFAVGESVMALVVPADARFKAKYRALRICKNNKSSNTQQQVPPPAPAVESDSSESSIDEDEKGIILSINNILETKGNVKLTSLAGDLSKSADFRAVVPPQKKSVKRFIAKYPQFFTIKDDVVFRSPDCPPIAFKSKSAQSTVNDSDDPMCSDGLSGEESSNDSDVAARADNGDPVSPITDVSPLLTSVKLKSVTDLTSTLTASILAAMVSRSYYPLKMSDLFRKCQHYGWEGMKTVAMVAQVIISNPGYFNLDLKSFVTLTPEGKKLKIENEFVTKGKATEYAKPMPGYTQKPVGDGLAKFPSAPPFTHGEPTPYHPFTSSAPQNALPFPMNSGGGFRNVSSVGMPTGKLTLAQTFANSAMNRAAYTPIGTLPVLSQSSKDQIPEGFGSLDSHSFPTSSVLTHKNGLGSGFLEDKLVYHSDNDDSFDEKFSPKSKQSPSSHCTEEESHFLSVVARGICLNAIGGREEVLNLLRKELEGMGVLQADGDGLGGALSRHLLCIQFDVGQKPKAKFQVFTPSGKISTATKKLATEIVTENSLTSLLSENHIHDKIVRVGRRLYGMDKTFHCMRTFTDGLDKLAGCTAIFRNPEPADVRVSDLLDVGEQSKVKIILTSAARGAGTTSAAACAKLRKYAEEKSSNSSVIVVDMEGQIFGFGRSASDARRFVCDSLDSQQNYLKEAVHHQPNYVVANSIDCVDTLNIIERINARGIYVYIEVVKSLEGSVRKVFKCPI